MKKKGIIIFIAIITVFIASLWGIKKFGKKEKLYSAKNTEALKHYKSGVNYVLMYYIKEAKREFSLAIQSDLDFPLPYLYQISLSMGPKETKLAEYYKKIAIPQKNWTKFEKEITSIFMEYTGKRGKVKGDKKFAKKLENFINNYADKVEIYPIVLPMYQKAIGDTNKLIKYYVYLQEKFPNNTQILNRLGYLYLSKRDYKNAENCFKKYIFIEPGNANPYDSIADLYFTLGDYKKAIENYEKALKIKPDFYNSKIKLAICYCYVGKLKLANQMLDQMIKLSDAFPYLKYSAYSLKGFVYFSGNEKEKLKELYEQFNPPKMVKCFRIPIKVEYALMFNDKPALSEALKESEHCHKFIKDMVTPFKIQDLIWKGNKQKTNALIEKSMKKMDLLTYDKKTLYILLISQYYIKTKQYEKIKPLLKYLRQEDKTYINFLISKAKNDKESCKEFAKKLLEYYNESDDNFYKKKEAEECLK